MWIIMLSAVKRLRFYRYNNEMINPSRHYLRALSFLSGIRPGKDFLAGQRFVFLGLNR